MKSIRLLLSVVVLHWMLYAVASAAALPDGFVYLEELAPGILLDVRYFGQDNFVGARVDGYLAPRVILTRQAAEALVRVQAQLEAFGLGLLVFDGYRPQRAVEHFQRWARDLQDVKTKPRYYPDVPKEELFVRGYIAARSSHSRGSTVDLTIVDRTTGTPLDMGSPFDFFGPVSWPSSMEVGADQRARRMLLQTLMVGQGFKIYDQEWWHFTLKDEPFPETYHDFPVE
ncbi:M15 family metallopeptidase [Megalodesulfovibrio gigas]|uniref:D-alanyl-D-alanine dipeptidase n=1 Tax=Megalodesulfovibrio gigas (strain ATCC 19364 / DSM 1382 / NCIMB 9332 / VKM B-1759) TaxID=1121448 RepID=T2GF22_MEGG1|nr:M15 family metallopeptidase [Megalodesulfovibrio gigas]AGW14769.1 putative D-Ala-D-Ala dipeptidase [Megalodesulfovibrio gigas DSM 1382 = ATCC 19364]